jgi:hypothetical protein
MAPPTTGPGIFNTGNPDNIRGPRNTVTPPPSLSRHEGDGLRHMSQSNVEVEDDPIEEPYAEDVPHIEDDVSS